MYNNNKLLKIYTTGKSDAVMKRSMQRYNYMGNIQARKKKKETQFLSF